MSVRYGHWRGVFARRSCFANFIRIIAARLTFRSRQRVDLRNLPAYMRKDIGLGERAEGDGSLDTRWRQELSDQLRRWQD